MENIRLPSKINQTRTHTRTHTQRERYRLVHMTVWKSFQESVNEYKTMSHHCSSTSPKLIESLSLIPFMVLLPEPPTAYCYTQIHQSRTTHTYTHTQFPLLTRLTQTEACQQFSFTLSQIQFYRTTHTPWQVIVYKWKIMTTVLRYYMGPQTIASVF